MRGTRSSVRFNCGTVTVMTLACYQSGGVLSWLEEGAVAPLRSCIIGAFTLPTPTLNSSRSGQATSARMTSHRAC